MATEDLTAKAGQDYEATVLTGVTIPEGEHEVVVAVDYDAEGFKISYVSSKEMDYEIKRGVAEIHRNYNRWIRNLAHDIHQSPVFHLPDMTEAEPAPAPATAPTSSVGLLLCFAWHVQRIGPVRGQRRIAPDLPADRAGTALQGFGNAAYAAEYSATAFGELLRGGTTDAR